MKQSIRVMFMCLLSCFALTGASKADTTTVFQGVLHTRLGNADLTNNGNTSLIVKNIGSSGNDGVRISLHDTSTSAFITVSFDSGAIPDTAEFRRTHYAKVNGVTNTILGIARYTKKSSRAWEFSVDHSQIGSTAETLKVFRHDTLLYTHVYTYSFGNVASGSPRNGRSPDLLPVPVVGTFWDPHWVDEHTESHEIIVHGESQGHTFDSDWDPAAVTFNPTGSPDTLLADHIVVISSAVSGIFIEEPYALDFQASKIPAFTFSAEKFSLGDGFKSTVFQGVVHTRLGDAVLSNQANAISVRNIGSSGNDGVRIAIPDTATSLVVDVDSNLTIPDGAYIQRHSYAGINGNPGLLLGSVKVQKVNSTTAEISTANFPAGGTNDTLKLYRTDTLVYTQSYPRNSVLGQITGIDRVWPIGYSWRNVGIGGPAHTNYQMVYDFNWKKNISFNPMSSAQAPEISQAVEFDYAEIISTSDSNMVIQQPYYAEVLVKDIPTITIVQESYKSYQYSIDPPGPEWCRSEPHKITWSGGDPAATVSLSLIDVNAWAVYSTIVSNTSNDGSYLWNIPGNIPPGLYEVYIGGGNPYDWRYSANFTIKNCDTCVAPPPNMVAWWPLDETSGSIAEDIVNGFNGTSSPGPIGPVVTGNGPAPTSEWPPVVNAGGAKVGSALYFWHQFDNRHIQVADNSTLRFGTSDFSIDAWVFITQYNGTVIQPIVEKMQYTGLASDVGYRLFLESGVLTANLAWGSGDTTIQVPFANQLTQGAWHHVALTVDRGTSSSDVRLYIDGALVQSASSSIGSSLDLSNFQSLIIGGSALGNQINYLDIGIDEVELFNAAISANEVASLYAANAQGKCKSHMTGMKFNDEDGNGIRNGFESGVPNWTIYIRNSSGNIRSTLTDANGNYAVAAVPGTYTLFEEYQSGWIQTLPLTVYYNATLGVGQTLSDLNFGNTDSCTSIPVDTCKGGVDDNFSAGNGPEPSSPSAALAAVTGGVYKGFDDNTTDRYFLHTLRCWSDSAVITSAVLKFRAKAIGVGTNDAIQLRQNGSTAVWVEFLRLLPGAGGTWTNQTATFTLDLANLPVSSIAAYTNVTNVLASLQDGDLDLAIQDDTEVDFVSLEYTLCDLCGRLTSIETPVEAGWNLVSLPVQVPDNRVSVLYPTALGNAFLYAGAYVSTATMDNCNGYWLKFPANKAPVISGNIICDQSCFVNAGWNLIGSISKPVAVSAIVSVPSGITASNFFGYSPSTGYTTASVVEPGKAYWVKLNQPGKLMMSANEASPSNRIRIEPTDELPPAPPSGTEEPIAAIPKDFALIQNFPNPFNPTTIIRYDLPAESHVTLIIYNVLGQQVRVLLNNEAQEAGFKSISLDASALSSGVYFYRLTAQSETGAFIDVKKMLLSK